ncbi:MAG: hypothetical protein QOH45_3329, partial [Pseudonocardiales bacterium]|nr:hypothetical protein [Pseudonocardiales bacterium]
MACPKPGMRPYPATQMVIIKRALAYPGVFALVGLIAGLGLFAFGLGGLLLVLVTVADGIFVLVDQRAASPCTTVSPA